MSNKGESKPKREAIPSRRSAQEATDPDIKVEIEEGPRRSTVEEFTEQDLQMENPFKPRSTKVLREPSPPRPPREPLTPTQQPQNTNVKVVDKVIESPKKGNMFNAKIEENLANLNIDIDVTPRPSATENSIPVLIKRPSQDRIIPRLAEPERVIPRYGKRPSQERIADPRPMRGVSLNSRPVQPRDISFLSSPQHEYITSRKSNDDLLIAHRTGFGFNPDGPPRRIQPEILSRSLQETHFNDYVTPRRGSQEYASPRSHYGRSDDMPQYYQRVGQMEFSKQQDYLDSCSENTRMSKRRSRIDQLCEDISHRRSRRDDLFFASTGRNCGRQSSSARTRATAATVAPTANQMNQVAMDKSAELNRPYLRIAGKNYSNDKRRKARNANLLNATLSLVREMDRDYVETLCFAIRDILANEGKSDSSSEC